MERKTIRKKTEINVDKEYVWKVLTEDKYNRRWLTEFSEGSYAETNWKAGSEIIFRDKSERALLGRIIVSNFRNVIAIAYEGWIVNGKVDTESDDAMAVKGTRESYQLAEKDGATILMVDAEVSEEWYDQMAAAYAKALEKIKEIAEMSFPASEAA